MLSNRLIPVFILIAAALASGCRTGLFGTEVPASSAEPPAPVAPVVVEGIRTSYADVVEKTSPAVVRILSEGRKQQALEQSPEDDFFRRFQGPQRPQLQRGVGSGVIVSADGTILTNAHVVDGADKITVLMADNKNFDAKLVGTDKPSDLAVLKIEAQNMPFLTLGNSDTVRVGDIVLAIGNPLGIGQTVTSGIISAKGRRTGLSYGNNNDSFEDFLQTDAPINRGNSGGALVNLTGELIGINSQILSPPGSGGGNIGIGFSIPSNMAKSVMEQLLKDGRVRRGMLGVNIQNLTDETAKALDLTDTAGVLVSNVRPGSAGEKAGLKRGDIITAINGEKMADSNVLRNKIAGTLPGTEVKLTVLRDGSSQELTATLDEFDLDGGSGSSGSKGSEQGPKQSESGKLGLSLQPLTQDTARQLNVPDGTEGLVVTEIDPSGVAAEAGIARGDVIMEINRQPVKTVDNVQSALNSAGEKPILILISRGGQVVYLTVRVK